MALRGRVQSIERVGCGGNGGEESEGDLGADEIIVDRLRDADHVDARFRNGCRAGHGAVATDHDERVEQLAADGGEACVGDVFPDRFAGRCASGAVARWICAVVRAENRAASGEDAADIAQRERAHSVLDESLEAVLDSDNLDSVLEDRGLRHGADDRVEAGAVAAACQNAESSDGWRHVVRREVEGRYARRDAEKEAPKGRPEGKT